MSQWLSTTRVCSATIAIQTFLIAKNGRNRVYGEMLYVLVTVVAPKPNVTATLFDVVLIVMRAKFMGLRPSVRLVCHPAIV